MKNIFSGILPLILLSTNSLFGQSASLEITHSSLKPFKMTVGELKEELDKFNDDNLPVVAYTPDGNNVIDIFVEKIGISSLGNYDTRGRQMYYDVVGSGNEEAVLISNVPSKKRY